MESYTDLMFSLPEELWISILKNVSSRDALNAFRAYPHISDAVHPHKALLLFGKVVPFLCDWEADNNRGLLTLSDLRSCRLVCKNWSMEVDFMFETRDRNLVDTAHSWQTDLKRFNLNANSWTSSLDIRFQSISDFAKFSQQFETLTGNRNPFPARSFEICLTGGNLEWDPEVEEVIFKREENPEATNAQNWTLLINFLQKFGKHIHNFTLATGLGYKNRQNLNGIIELKNLAKCLRRLPNLQSFHLSILHDKWIFNSISELQSTMASDFVHLSNLEIASFQICGQEPQLSTSFLNLFSQSMKRVFVYPSVDYGKPLALPALIRIDVITESRPDPDDLEYINLFAKVAPNLCKVTFHLLNNNKTYILSGLENFPNRENFKLGSDSKELWLTLQTDK